MTKYHPDLNLLTEYASGTLDWGLSLGVATHLHFCHECRARVEELNNIGGAIFGKVQPVAVGDNVFNNLMARIASGSTANDITVLPTTSPELTRSNSDTMLQGLPKVVEKLLPRDKQLKWKMVSPALRAARLTTGQNKYEVAFHRIGAGGKVAEHDHGGLEVTIVLKGCFSDDTGVYNEGDFLVKQPGEIHRPTAAQNQDCLCFSIQEAPVRLTGILGKILNPLLSVKPG